MESQTRAPAGTPPDTPLIPAAAYVRMSTEHQQYSTENQMDVLKEYAARHGMEIIRIYSDEGKSGLGIQWRGSLQQMIADVQTSARDYEAILVYDISRWGRFQDADESGYYEFQCRKAGVHVHYCAEQFVNDGSPTANIIKSVKRSMAGEYSRELSVKVFKGQCTLIEKGFRQGGHAGFGLRRALIDEQRQFKGVLTIGEQKSIQTDRVILVPGPDEETALVRQMYRWFVDDGLTEMQIAERLNGRGITTDFGRLWSRSTVHQVLTNEKYIGNNVYNRRSYKLKQRRVVNPPEMYSVVVGGAANMATNPGSAILGGIQNGVYADAGMIGGGTDNTVTMEGGAILGGANNQVNAPHAVVVGGTNNHANGTATFIGGGQENQVNSEYATVAGGQSNQANARVSTIAGGDNNQANADYTTVAGGQANYANAPFSAILGGQAGRANRYGEQTQSAGCFSLAGDAQTCVLIARGISTDDSWTTLALDGQSEPLTIAPEFAAAFHILLVAHTLTDATEMARAAFEISGLIDNVSGEIANDYTLHAMAFSHPALDAGVASGGGSLLVQVKGLADTTIRWVARITLVEVSASAIFIC